MRMRVCVCVCVCVSGGLPLTKSHSFYTLINSTLRLSLRERHSPWYGAFSTRMICELCEFEHARFQRSTISLFLENRSHSCLMRPLDYRKICLSVLSIATVGEREHQAKFHSVYGCPYVLPSASLSLSLSLSSMCVNEDKQSKRNEKKKKETHARFHTCFVISLHPPKNARLTFDFAQPCIVSI